MEVLDDRPALLLPVATIRRERKVAVESEDGRNELTECLAQVPEVRASAL